ATTVWLGGVPRRAITLIVLALSLILAQSISLIGNLEASSFYTLLSGAVYLYIFTSYACFFSKDVDKLITLNILSATVSYNNIIYIELHYYLYFYYLLLTSFMLYIM